MLLLPITGMALVAAFLTGLATGFLICTKHRGKYYVPIWATIGLVNGVVALLLGRFIFRGFTFLAAPGVIFGVLGLIVWRNARHRVEGDSSNRGEPRYEEVEPG